MIKETEERIGRLEMNEGQKGGGGNDYYSIVPEPELQPEDLAGKIVVIGIGNPYMRDDGIGIQVASELQRMELGPRVLVYAYHSMDLTLLSFFQRASRIIIVDALKSGFQPGHVSKYEISENKRPLHELPNLHELQLFDIVDLARETGMLPPPSSSSNLVVVGIEPFDCRQGEGLTSKVSEALPTAISTVLQLLNES